MSIFSLLFGGCTKQPAGSFVISDKTLCVRGWGDPELQQIMGNFEKLYRDRLPSNFSTEVHAIDGGVFRITFPTDIDSQIFCYFINYIQYPEGFDLKSRTILVAGKATIKSDFLPSKQSLIGKPITLYIPSNDKTFDVVFGEVDGQSYEYSFACQPWRRVQDPRLPVGINELK